MPFDFKAGILAQIGSLPVRRAVTLGLTVAAAMSAVAPAAGSTLSYGAAGFAGQQYRSALEQAAATAGHPATCFGSLLRDEAGARLGAATVWLYQSITFDDGGKGRIAGTGTIVSGSSGPEGHNRIVTASHVMDATELPPGATLDEPGWVHVVGSDGLSLGMASVVAKASPIRDVLASADRVVVIAMDHPTDAYDQIRGVSLARNLPTGHMTGLVATPMGLSHGASGGPVVDADVAMIAVTSSVSLDGKGAVKAAAYKGTDIMAMNDAGLQKADVPLWLQANSGKHLLVGKAHDRVYALPLTDPSILMALGGASAASKPMPPSPEGYRARIAGYPSTTCMAWTATIAAFDPADPMQRISATAADAAQRRGQPVANDIRVARNGGYTLYGDDARALGVIHPHNPRNAVRDVAVDEETHTGPGFRR